MLYMSGPDAFFFLIHQGISNKQSKPKDGQKTSKLADKEDNKDDYFAGAAVHVHQENEAAASFATGATALAAVVVV